MEIEILISFSWFFSMGINLWSPHTEPLRFFQLLPLTFSAWLLSTSEPVAVKAQLLMLCWGIKFSPVVLVTLPIVFYKLKVLRMERLIWLPKILRKRKMWRLVWNTFFPVFCNLYSKYWIFHFRVSVYWSTCACFVWRKIEWTCAGSYILATRQMFFITRWCCFGWFSGCWYYS